MCVKPSTGGGGNFHSTLLQPSSQTCAKEKFLRKYLIFIPLQLYLLISKSMQATEDNFDDDRKILIFQWFLMLA